MAERILTVQGEARIKAEPDQIVVNIKLTGKSKTIFESSQTLLRKLEHFYKDVDVLGFKREEMKTKGIEIEEEINYLDSKRKFLGYLAITRIKLRFDFDKQRLVQVLNALGSSRSEPELRLEFTLKDIEPFRKQLLEKAIQNATANATVLASASNVRLGNIIQIYYGKLDINIRNMALGVTVGVDYDEFDIQPESLSLEDKVGVVWEIF
jgi:uncharacterized protein YggE